MRVVDFTPQWYLEVRGEQRSSRFRIGGLLVVMVLMVACSMLASSDSKAAMADLDLLRQSFYTQSGLVGCLDRLDKEHADSARQVDMLDDTSGGVTMSEIFKELSQLMPDALSIRRVDYSKALRIQIDPEELSSAVREMEPPPETTTLEISGLSQKGRDIGSLVSKMSRSPFFFDVQLRYERARDVLGEDVVEFVIDCKMPAFE